MNGRLVRARASGYGLRIGLAVGLLLEQATGRTFGQELLVEEQCQSRL